MLRSEPSIHSMNPLAVEDSLDEMDRTLYTAWRAMLETLAATRELLPPGSMPDLIVEVEDPPVPPAPRIPLPTRSGPS
jgi:hypothetical protein